ncbi:MAG: hypothetical protein JWM21_79 [Acidobacteria bacterium]|nr:hypothetical protein [Acidobacteriota bacterium]
MQIDTDQAHTKLDLILAVWESLDCESVGAKELKQIQVAVAKRFGDSAVDSPAAIARLLADEGAHLRHPEVLECDAKWRERKLARLAVYPLNFANFSAACETMTECERLRRELAQREDRNGWRDLRDAVALSRQDRLLVSAGRVISESDRAEAKEIAAWLEVWLRTPELFADWLDLRRASPQFRKQFE